MVWQRAYRVKETYSAAQISGGWEVPILACPAPYSHLIQDTFRETIGLMQCSYSYVATFKLPRVSPFAYSAVFWVPNIMGVQACYPEMFMHSSHDDQLNI